MFNSIFNKGVVNKRGIFWAAGLLVITALFLSLSIGAKGCSGRSKANTKTGSSSVRLFPDSPTGLIAIVISPYQINISWGDNSDNEVGFDIERKIGVSGNYVRIATLGINANIYIDEELLPDTLYFYRITAFNSMGVSAYSTEASAVTGGTIGISAGEYHTILLKLNNTIWGCGQNDFFQLGLGVGDTENKPFPVQIEGTTDWSNVSSGGSQNIGFKINGSIFCWGANNNGQLGTGDNYDSDIPYLVGTDTDWSMIATGGVAIPIGHTVAIKNNNTIWSCGWNAVGQLGFGDTLSRNTFTQIGTESDWLQAAASLAHTMSIRNNRTLWGWGGNGVGELGISGTVDTKIPNPIGTDSDWSVVAAGAENASEVDPAPVGHTLALKTNGIIWGWGYNEYAPLGLGFASFSVATPRQVGIESDWQSVATGNRHTIARKTDGTLWGWGFNAYGQVGVGNSNSRLSPAKIGADVDWSLIICGGWHSVAIKNNNTVWTWGDNGAGQLGLGDNDDRLVPTQISLGAPSVPLLLTAIVRSQNQIDFSWIDISNNETGFEIERKIGNNGTYFVLANLAANTTTYSDTTVVPLTTYYYRVRSYKSTYSNYSNEVIISTSGDWVFINAGYWHTAAVKNNGTLWSWGENSNGQLGFGDQTNRSIPTQIGNDTDWARVAAGGGDNPPNEKGYTLAIKTNGTLFGWGWCQYGQLGIGIVGDSRYTPVQVGSLSDWSLVEAGYAHTVAIKTNKTMWSWGYNSVGQLGLGNSGSPATNRSTPAQIGSTSDWVAVALGDSHTVAIKDNGTIWAFGNNSAGQLGTGDNIRRITPAQVTTDSDWASVTCGEYHTLAIKTNMTLWAWGANSYGQLGNDSVTNKNSPIQIGTDSNWFIVSAGKEYSLGRKNDGTIWSWGNNSQGELGLGDSGSQTKRLIPTQISISSDYLLLSAGGYHAITLKNNGTIWSWGNNNYGQLGLGSSVNTVMPIEINVTITPYLPPSALTATVQSNSVIALSWIDNSDNEDGFSIERKFGIAGTWSEVGSTGANVIVYPDTVTPSATAYYYRVRANNAAGYSSYSNEASAISVVIDSPSLLSASVISSSQINLSWTDNSNNEDGFRIERKFGASGTWAQINTVTAGTIAYSDINTSTGFTASSIYYYRVNAFNAFGESSYSNEAIANTPGRWFIVAAKGSHSIALKTDNTIWIWGDNQSGQLGLGNSGLAAYRNTPTHIGTVSDWFSIVSGLNHSLAVRSGGAIWAWGDNTTYGQLGDPTIVDVTIPNKMGTDSDWSMVFSGDNHSFAIKTNYTLWAWGDNSYSQLGDPGIGDPTIPNKIGIDSDWSVIVGGTGHTIALKTAKTIWVWGLNTGGQLGLGDNTQRDTPVQIGSNSDWSKVAAGGLHTLAIKSNGTIWSWGGNSQGQLGLGNSGAANNRKTPTQIDSDTDWVKVAAGTTHTIAQKLNGTLWAWGLNSSGQLGLGDLVRRMTPTQIGSESDWATIGAGQSHALARKTNGTLWSWGLNTSGQLGLGGGGTRNTPAMIGE